MTALRRWAVVGEDGGYLQVAFGPTQDRETLLVLMPGWVAEHVVREHNRQVDAVEARPVVGDLEAFAVRVAKATVRELIRDALPRWLRRRSTPRDKPVYERTAP